MSKTLLSRAELMKEIASAIEDKMIDLGYNAEVRLYDEEGFVVKMSGEGFAVGISGLRLSHAT